MHSGICPVTLSKCKFALSNIFFFLFYTFQFLDSSAQQVIPTPQQLAWHEMEFYFFIHFGPNTFTDKEWGQGDEPEDIFNPTQLDCRQWARIAKQAGAKGIIITAKHHDGFCLWPSKYSTHTVRESKWKDGMGDVLKELSQACREQGLKFGVYISPWDRNHPKYGTPGYNEVYVNTMKEIFASYGNIFELWWDGANGEGPNGRKQVFDFRRFENTVRSISPKTILFSDIGPDTRWVGNERGIAGKTNWNYLDTAGFTRGEGGPPQDTLNSGNAFGKNWIPAECDVSIRPGWFWHENENSKVKNQNELFDLYLKSVGRGANLLLNVPPDRRGLIHENDSAALMEFKKLRDRNFSNNLLSDARAFWEMDESFLKDSAVYRAFNYQGTVYGINRPVFTVELAGPKKVNCIVLREAIHLGQSVENFKIILFNKNQPAGEISGTTIGRKRILTFPAQTITSFKVYLTDRYGNDNVSGVAAYLVDEGLVEKK
jgi:alpha-L-fucosidase